jgi:hypothetical protein
MVAIRPSHPLRIGAFRDWLARMNRLLLAVFIALLATAATAMAAATMTYRGTTDQGRKAYVKVKNGEIQSVNVPWIAHPTNCTPHNGYSLGDGKPFLYFNSPPDEPIVRNGNKFSATRHLTLKEGGGGKAVVDVKLSGKFSGKRATGTTKISANAHDQFGHHVCKFTVSFSTKLP